MNPQLFQRVLLLGLFSGTCSVFAADAAAPAPANPPATAAAPAPATAATPPAAPGSVAAPAGTAPTRGGRGGGRGGAPATPEEVAQMAKLADLPAYTAGLGDGDYSTGPNYTPAPELTVRPDVPKGKVAKFIMNATDSKFYAPAGLRGTTETRDVTVYIPSQYVPGTLLPVIVSADAWGARVVDLPTMLDNMIADHRLPVMGAVMIMHGGGDGPGSERGLEYDTVSGKFAEFVEAEVLPRVEKDYGVTFTKDPEARMTFGGSSGGSVAFNMAWFHPELYRRAVIYSGTFVNQQAGPDAPHGAWSYHETIIPSSPVKPIRVWLEVGELDNGATASGAGLHNWVLANQAMAAVLKAKGYHYQLVFAKQARHTDSRTVAQTLPQALEFVWKGYPIAPAKAPAAIPAAPAKTTP